jgi:hypothetical protein
VERFLNPNGAVPPRKYTISSGTNEHHQEHHANQKFGWHQICQFRAFIYYMLNIFIFQLFLQYFIKKLKQIFASGGQGALFEKTAPWTPAKAFY